MRWDQASDQYVQIAWDEAFAGIGAEVKPLAPKLVVFYTSGRASLEASYMYQLFARMYGNNNLPDSSNMCHESTSVALPETIGVPVGTMKLEDFEHTDCMLFFGQNVGVNSPRMLHQLQEASGRGVPIITFNPLRERGLERFINPQSPADADLARRRSAPNIINSTRAAISPRRRHVKALIEDGRPGKPRRRTRHRRRLHRQAHERLRRVRDI